jgi:hypothetical protein
MNSLKEKKNAQKSSVVVLICLVIWERIWVLSVPKALKHEETGNFSLKASIEMPLRV